MIGNMRNITENVAIQNNDTFVDSVNGPIRPILELFHYLNNGCW